jgi:hypothetical protein
MDVQDIKGQAIKDKIHARIQDQAAAHLTSVMTDRDHQAKVDTKAAAVATLQDPKDKADTLQDPQDKADIKVAAAMQDRVEALQVELQADLQDQDRQHHQLRRQILKIKNQHAAQQVNSANSVILNRRSDLKLQDNSTTVTVKD